MKLANLTGLLNNSNKNTDLFQIPQLG